MSKKIEQKQKTERESDRNITPIEEIIVLEERIGTTIGTVGTPK
jgi:hypothetical protein